MLPRPSRSALRQRLADLPAYAQRLTRLFTRRRGSLGRALFFFGTYCLWVAAFRMLVLTFATYFALSSSSHGPPRFEDINESLGSAELTLLALGALAYGMILRAFHPVTSTTGTELFTPRRFEKRFVPGFFHGALLACGVVLAFLLSGIYRYLGSFVQFEETPLAIFNVLFRILILGVFAYFEEFIFRHKIVRHLRIWLAPDHAAGQATGLRLVDLGRSTATLTASEGYLPSLRAELAPAAIVALLYCGVKSIQFDLGLMQWLTLLLLSLALSVRNLGDHGDFTRGAGFWTAVLVVFQPLLSLPIFGHEFTGLVLVKYQAQAASAAQVAGAAGAAAAAAAPGLGDDSTLPATLRLFTGGAGGPLSSLAFQMMLMLDIARGVVRYKKGLPSTEEPALT